MKLEKINQRDKPNYNKIKIEVCHNDSKQDNNSVDLENLKAVFEYKT
jgi:hypothetical protein